LVSGARWDLVFNIAEGIRGRARESQVPALLDVYGVPYTFSDPLVLAVCLDKSLAKRVVRDAGVPTPEFVLVERPEDADAIALAAPLFVKPVGEGTSVGVTASSLVHDRAALPALCRALLGRYRQPVLVERYLPGREVTVGITGTGARARAIGALEVELFGPADDGVYSFSNKKLFEDRVRYRACDDDDAVARRAQELALAAWRALGCRDGGRVDLRCDEHGEPAFIECNPLAGLNPEISDLAILARLRGTSYRELISAILASARERLRA
jgi:D-alanine-D-alanine ligase